ncbi:DUF5107 domain-containing protein [Microterricola viridarii]|uniref:Tetratricopeptide repeat-containing protein n=1 Tax=Microterricola viridarii TaxID=412690 RepID=A0A1H1N2J6_9MICO|nr:DUF5107 domain-containing protein [Microterricola viridarii]SDR93204.1 Tetratricopeptide repeat-containing protein [Microterricola viridarii]
MSTESGQNKIILPDAAGEHAERVAAGGATAWREPLEIRSYAAGEPDRYPMFFEHRVYQGSSGRVYPIPFTDSIETTAHTRSWDAIHLENKWLRLVVLPELGGRIHIGYDKSADYDFFYRNNVIKPALVGLAGPWISGGVEFNWPQHHRPATYLPVDTEIEYGADGSVTVWCSDHDPFSRMKGMHGIRLRPDSALIELVARLHNRTSETETFLWWANVAARVHDNYQSFFPTDVQWVADHARRAITAFPAADRPYYGHDYTEHAATGGDRIDFYKNIPVPTSYMVTGTQDDFFGGYDHDAQAGFVHWADRRVAPGKKLWTWGDAPFGRAWDALLTDEDGPYIELMAGVFTDNQPDFTFIAPGETKTFSQYWYPIRSIGVVHQANLDCAVHLSVQAAAGGTLVRVGVAATGERGEQRILLTDAAGATLGDWAVPLAPETPFTAVVEVPGEVRADELTLDVVGALRWRPRVEAPQPEPETAVAAPLPAEIDSLDELYATGVHLAQYRHPTRAATDYWREALRRDPDDVRSNLAMARHAYDGADYETAHEYARSAMGRLTARNLNPDSGEASYRLGQVLRRLGETAEAYDAFAKAVWDRKWAQPAEFECARLDAAAGRDDRALEHAARALRLDADDLRTRALLVVLLRRVGRSGEAAELLAATRALDPLDQLSRALAGEADGGAPLSADAASRVDVAVDLASFGAFAEAVALLEDAASMPATAAGNVRPLALYTLAAVLERAGDAERAGRVRIEASGADAVRTFPSLLDHHDALQAALQANPDDVQARALLGMLLFHHRRHDDALEQWEYALELGSEDATVLRNAAIAWFNRRGDGERARAYYERAIALRPGDARLWYESDQLLKRLAVPPAERLARIPLAATSRDDLAVEYAELLTELGRPAEALALLESRPFSPWEGGEGRSLAAWDRARAALGMPLGTPPASLGEARPDVQGPQAESVDGGIDYFATSLPDLLLFTRVDG